MEVLVFGTFGGLVSFAVVYLLGRYGSRKPTKAAAGLRELRYSTGYKVTGYLCLPGALFFAFIGYMAHRQSGSLTLLMMMSLLSLLSLLQAYIIFIWKVRWSGEKLQSIHPFRTYTISWKDVVGIRPLNGIGAVLVKDNRGQTIFVPQVRSTIALARLLRLIDHRLLGEALFNIEKVSQQLRRDETNRFSYELRASSEWGNETYQLDHGALVTVDEGAGTLFVAPHAYELHAGKVFWFPATNKLRALVLTDEHQSLKLSVVPLKP